MRTSLLCQLLPSLVCALVGSVACGSDSNGKAQNATGGAAASIGGGPANTGGVAANTGGSTGNTGGTATSSGGVVTNTGGAVANSGGAGTGGVAAGTGGVAPNTGGVTANTGGVAIGSGGVIGSGGKSANTGGVIGSGGKSANTGGKAGSGGGAPTGGLGANTGGKAASTGGAAASTGGGGSAPISSCDPADRTSLDTPLTTCSETSEAYPGESVPACTSNPGRSSCPPQQMDVAAPAQRCGTMVGCALDRNEAIDGTVETTYTPGSSDYAPPEPPHDNGADPISPIGTWMHAEATAWFARPGSGEAQTIRNTDQPGSCGITSRDLMIMAIPTPQFGQNANPAADVWNLAYWCGACAEVVGPSGKRARVQIVTQRAYDDDGNYYSIDLPANGDNQVDTPYSMIDSGQLCSIGLPVDWRIVPCEVCGGIVLSYTPGFNTGTPAFRILNHRLPIVDAYYMNSSGTWQRIQRDSVNQYHTGQANPMRLRVIAIDGSTIEGSFPAYSAGKSYEATSQF